MQNGYTSSFTRILRILSRSRIPRPGLFREDIKDDRNTPLFCVVRHFSWNFAWFSRFRESDGFRSYLRAHCCWLVYLLSLSVALALMIRFSDLVLVRAALDISYIVPIFCRRWYRNHPDVHFKPGPFYMSGALGWIANCTCIMSVPHSPGLHSSRFWLRFVLFHGEYAYECVDGHSLSQWSYASRLISLSRRWTSTTLRWLPLPCWYCQGMQFLHSRIFVAPWSFTHDFIFSIRIWYFAGGRKHYKGPISNINRSNGTTAGTTVPSTPDKETESMHSQKEKQWMGLGRSLASGEWCTYIALGTCMKREL